MSGAARIWSVVRRLLALPFILLIKFYQLCISPLKPPTCRFTPTCSQYALEAFRKYGPFKGFWLSARSTRWKLSANTAPSRGSG